MTSQFSSNHTGDGYTPSPGYAPTGSGTQIGKHPHTHQVGANQSAPCDLANNSTSAAQAISSTFDQVMNNYYADCKYRIKKYWNPASRVGTLRVDTHFRIHRNGDITEIKIIRTSGSSSDDLIAMQAIKRAIPLARLPLGCPEYLEVDFVFEINFGSNRDPFQQTQNSLCPPRRKVGPTP